MSVEGGSSAGAVGVGAAVSMGPSIRGISSGIEGGFGARGGLSLGGIRGGIADLEATVPLGRIGFSIVNEGPVIPEALNTMAIVAKPMSSVIQQAEEVAAAAWAAPQLNATDAITSLRNPDVSVKIATSFLDKLGTPRNDNVPILAVEPFILPQLEPAVVPLVASSQTLVLDVSPAPLPQPLLQEQEVEEIVTEKITKEHTGMVEEEEMVEERMYLEDKEASAQRRHEVKEAVGKAKAEADRLGLQKIAGWLVAKFLPAEHAGNRSQAVKEKGPDGSYQETVEAIAGAGQLESEEEAVEKFDRVVAAKKPVKYGENGTPVGSEDVARVFKYHVVRPAVTHEIVIKRSETSLEDDPELAEVFGRAA